VKNERENLRKNTKISQKDYIESNTTISVIASRKKSTIDPSSNDGNLSFVLFDIDKVAK